MDNPVFKARGTTVIAQEVTLDATEATRIAIECIRQKFGLPETHFVRDGMLIELVNDSDYHRTHFFERPLREATEDEEVAYIVIMRLRGVFV